MFDHSMFTSLISGGIAGLFVDIILFPIDTIKTRLQSEQGFWRSGGFKTVYKGLGPVAAGSAPTAALFFCTYESMKYNLGELYPTIKETPYVHMLAASIGEIVACSIRVPVEIVKQRRQVLVGKFVLTKTPMSSLEILFHAYKSEGFFKGVYRGYTSTLLREIPFSFIQFPLWEYFKKHWLDWTGSEELTPWSVAICGALAGGIAAGLTTPLDVAKTRIMLAERDYTGNSINLSVQKVLKDIYRTNGIRGIFSGFIPRVAWITFGGAIFFGCYDFATRFLKENNFVSSN